MITHREAEILTSARQDAPLDPVVERELQAHLATCDECRAFAIATERLTASIKAMPSIPANPRTRREVMEQVHRGRNPFARLLAGIGGGFQAGPVLAAAATLVIIGLFGWLALDRLVLDDGDGTNNQIAAVPTQQAVERLAASPTQEPATETPEPTATDVPPTETPEPTATDVPPIEEPEPTATDVPPTETPEPTATDAPPIEEPEPTATDVPPTQEPEPTSTTAPTEEPAVASVPEDEEGEPTDLTTMAEESEGATEEPTQEPTREPTTVPTEEPTPESTLEPTTEPTEEPTTEPEPTNTPGIEPMEGSQVIESDGTGAADPTQLPDGVGSGPSDDEAPPIESTDNEASEDTGDESESGDDVGGQSITAIEPMGGDEEEVESTPDDDDAVEELDEPEGQSLEAVSVRYTGIDGDPSGHLGLTREGRLEFMPVPDGASRTTAAGFRVEFADTQPGVIHLCGDGYCEPALEAPESEAWQGDVPLGVIGDTTYFLRLYSDRTEVVGSPSDGTSLYDPQVLVELGPTSAPAAVYENSGIMFAWLPGGQWLEISQGSAQVFSGAYSDPYNLRFAPLANNGPLIGYFSNGTLVIAPVTAPDQAIFSMPTDGIDFDLTGGGTRVAVIRGSDIVIYDIDGNLLQVYSGTDVQPGSLIWLLDGIVYVDRNTGTLYQIPETAP